MKVSILLLASGRGTRLGTSTPKAFVELAGVALVERSLARLAAAIDATDREVVLAVHPEDRSTWLEPLRPRLESLGLTHVVDGGETRQESMERALAATSPNHEWVLVHDAARPFLPIDATRRALDRARDVGAALLAWPAADTLKRATPDGLVETTLDRAGIWLAQTPQIAAKRLLRSAMDRAAADGFVGTDDVSLLEHAGIPVALVAGSPLNMKITTPDDLAIAERLVASPGAEENAT